MASPVSRSSVAARFIAATLFACGYVSALSPWPTASSTMGRGIPTVVGTLKVILGRAGDGIAAPVGMRVLFSMATAVATSGALTQVMGGILVHITYRVTRR